MASEECHLVYSYIYDKKGWNLPEAFSSSAANNICQVSTGFYEVCLRC